MSGNSGGGSKGGGRGGRSGGRGRSGGGGGGGRSGGGARKGGRGRGGGGGGGRGPSASQDHNRPKEYIHTQAPKKGKAFSTPYEVPASGAVAPFDLFCGVLLGIMPDGSYKNSGSPNLNEAAKRFRRPSAEVKLQLKGYGMDQETLRQVDFDVSLARLDIQVAPEGIDRRELARGLYDELVEYNEHLADIETRIAAGEEPLAELLASQNTAAAEGDEGQKPPRRRRNRKSGARADDADSGAVAVAEAPEKAEKNESATPADADADPGAETGEGGEARPVRRIRRSPVRRGSGE